MAAIVTDPFKKQLTQTVFNEVTNTTARYYIGIGRSEQWDSSETVPDPTDSPRSIRNLRSSLQSLKSASDVTYVIPRYNWSSGTIYQAYDDDFTSIPNTSYYVLTEDNQVYICLQQSKNASGAAQASTVKPTGTTTKPFKTADGYIWKFLFALSATRASKFLSANFVPVEKILDSAGGVGLSSLEIQQATVQDSAVAGQILNVVVTNGGTGYDPSSPPVVTIEGDGVRASATATVSSGGVVSKIELDSSTDSAMAMGQGYNFASVTIAAPSSGTLATARAIIGPDSGIGRDCRDELKSTSLMFNTKPAGNEGNDFIVDQDFRQVTLIRNPKKNNDSDLTGSSGKVLNFLQVTSSTDAEDFTVDTVITGGTSNAKAIIDEVLGDKIYFHQSEVTGFKPFEEAETISGGGENATLVAEAADADSDAFTLDDVRKTSGQVLYIENRAPVVRSSTQTEDIKIVLTL